MCAFRTSLIATQNDKVRMVSEKKHMSCEDLKIHLIARGYIKVKPKCRTWQSAYIFRRDNAVLCILFRKNGIDMRYYASYKNEMFIDRTNHLVMAGGELFKNYFNESRNLITKKIKIVSSYFITGRIMDEMRIEDGRSYLLNPKYQCIKEISKTEFIERSENAREAYERRKNDRDWRDICTYVEEDCGGYWGDGVWS
jgi:hypothetical protein